ncbi:MAG: hypothetical protein ACFFE8_11185 [Candidatus Heimdallarchaeota archaeon]
MDEKWRVTPKRIGRSRKIQVRQFEPEEIFIEYELEVKDPSHREEAIKEATRLAVAYLDTEEQKLRGISERTDLSSSKPQGPPPPEYSLRITDEGNKLGDFKLKPSDDLQFANFLHLWFDKDNREIYVGYLRKDTGDFKFKVENKEILKKYGIKKGVHFRTIRTKPKD